MAKKDNGPLFRDSMDPSRVVSPQGVKEGRAQVRVYFQTKAGSLNYAGKTWIPAYLFNESSSNERVGFTPVSREDVTEA
jgi:hypothetical protein